MAISDVINSIPATVWSGVFGAFIALLGVIITNWSNTQRLKVQLKHDSDEKEKERKSKLRHDLYLKAAEEVVKARSALVTLAQVDFTQNINVPLYDFSVAISKLTLVADDEVAFEASNLMAIYGALYLKLLSKVVPLQDLKIDIKIQDDLYSNSQIEIQRILSTMTEDNESGNFNGIKRNLLNDSFEFQMKQASQYSDKRDKSYVLHNNLHLEFVRFFISEMKEIGLKQVGLMIKIRKEMGIKSDFESYERILKIQNDKANQELEILLLNLEAWANS